MPADEDFINKSLLEQLNASADTEPISSDSDAPTSGSYRSTTLESPDSSPPLTYHHMEMISQPHLLHRSGSPPANAPHTLLHHIQPQDSSYPHRPLQNGLYSLNGSQHAGNMTGEFSERMGEGQKAKMNGLNTSVQRQTFTAIPNATRSSRHTAASASTNQTLYRDTSNNAGPQAYFTPNEIYPPHLTSPTQPQLQPFDTRSTFDFAGSNPGPNGGNHPKTTYPVDPYISNNPSSSFAMGPGKPLQGQPPINQPQLNGFRNNTYPNPVQISSQTPYGPHIATGIGASNGGSTGNGGAVSGPNGVTQEEISTIFVVGFPDDMQEREFQNMFTFSNGFEAATLKIPNKEYTSYGGLPGTAPGPSNIRSGSVSGPGSFGFQGSNDPYNLVTVNQGGVVVDGGRDGTMTSWPAPQLDENLAGSNHFFGGAGNANGPPRKQIIGFAKFRTREEAMIARDMLQGRRVDIEKGAVLKAEMAKKNLHTKRGVGPVVPGGMATTNASLAPSATNGALPPAQGLGLTAGVGPNHPMLQQQQQFVPDGYPNDLLNVRDREMATMNAMGLASNFPQAGGRTSHWQHQDTQNLPADIAREKEDEDRNRDIYGAMGLSGSTKIGRDEFEREARKTQQKDALRLRSGSAYDAFHSVPTQQGFQRQATPGSNGFNPNFAGQQQSLEHMDLANVPGPWDTLRNDLPRGPAVMSSSSSGRSSPSLATVNPALHGFPQRKHSPPSDGQESGSRAPSESSVAGHSQSGTSSSVRNGSDNENEITTAMGDLTVTTENGNTSPQLPSPASGASSGSTGTRNRVDQNPPINTLYVGNLPTTPPPMGNDLLEESLRDLFRARPGFRRLSFKQKSSGPMCFVEFEDVHAASKTINELSGNTLNGLVRGGGIRLSYSRNPLGVRTPTSASTPGPVLQQQQQQLPPGVMHGPTASFAGQPLSGSNQNHHAYMMSPPPPRFANTASAPFGGSNALAGGPYFGNGGGVNYPAYRMTSPHDQSPPGGAFSPFELGGSANIPDHSPDPRQLEQPLHHDHHHIHRPLSPPSHNLEAARAA
ncbi:hypothetical protein PQX77_004763 [Marasmius sp. AFHP31]|nr:hypothetical protein PQX77_004763 [Marasmius sp. AFHP31]